MDRVDVAIVGGGPAGASAARAAAQEGADAVVVEKGVPREDRDFLGPDSTDAAGLLDYWLDIMGLAPGDFPDDVILRPLDGADFVGPNESVSIRETGIDAGCERFGYTVHRARFDDWLRDRAEAVGAEYRVGTSVSGVESDRSDGYRHTLSLADGDAIEADYLVLADGPQRTVTLDALDQFTPAGWSVADYLSPDRANHIAYQEYRRIPKELYEPELLKFWWGYMPGHTAYPWIFPNDGNVARVGLTMPIALDLDDIPNREDYELLREDDEQVPSGGAYVRRLLEREYPEYDLDDFPRVEDRGKRKGTETYPISSTRPIESPVKAGVAVAGGAMGGTSAFHEGGDHVAYVTGELAGRLAANDQLDRYNDAWHDSLEAEFLRNVSFAEIVRGWGPRDWDDAFAAIRRMQQLGGNRLGPAVRSGWTALKILLAYKWTKRGFSDRSYVQIREDDYVV